MTTALMWWAASKKCYLNVQKMTIKVCFMTIENRIEASVQCCSEHDIRDAAMKL